MRTEPDTKKIGFWSSTAMVIGNMIGSGIFLLPASLALYGGIGMVGWVCAALGAILLAYTFGALSSHAPDTIGGPYIYTRLGLGDFAAFLVAWGYWVAIWATNAAIAVAIVGYLQVFFPILGRLPLVAISVGLGFIWLFTWINSKPLKTVAGIQLITTILKVIPIGLIGIFGLFYIRWDHFVPFNISGTSDFTAITSTATLTLFAFLGMESAGIISADTADGVKTVKRATIIGTFITIVVYISSSMAIMGIIPPDDLALSTAPFADAAQRFWGPSAEYVVAGCAVVATMGALNGWILLQGRIPLAAAQDQLFPRIFGKVNANGSPIIGIILSSILASGLMMLNYSKSLVEAFTFMMMLSTLSTLIPYLFSAASLAIVSFQKEGRQFSRTIWLSLATFIFCIWIIVGSGPDIVFYGFLLLMAGVPFYVLLRRPVIKD